MYKRILVTLENSETDGAILAHIEELARFCSAEVILIHVADGFAARNQEALNLADSEEIKKDRKYLEHQKANLSQHGLIVDAILETGEPAKKILQIADDRNCDLIAMATHGHRLIGDLILGSVSSTVRHRANIPVLLIRSAKQ